ncbi:MAG: hypothetical protein JWO32_2316 [Bacteroidetes bacterium]|nr:hypothetical protein [Bacteroidota bacterium]
MFAMRDVFWTIIVIWLFYQIVTIFKNSGKRKSNLQQPDTHTETKNDFTPNAKKDVKSVLKKHADKDGEYIDYEEVK